MARESETRTVVSFRSSAFNSTEIKDYFINNCCFGDDLARWLIARLRANGVETESEPGQEDFGWYFRFKFSGGTVCILVGFQPGECDKDGLRVWTSQDPGRWVCTVTPHRSLLRPFSGVGKQDLKRAAEIVHYALKNAQDISDIRWHTEQEFDAEPGSESP